MSVLVTIKQFKLRLVLGIWRLMSYSNLTLFIGSYNYLKCERIFNNIKWFINYLYTFINQTIKARFLTELNMGSCIMYCI